LMMCGVAFIAAGVLLWFDAVGRIGAGKEAILGGGSFEILFIVLLGAVILSERLNRLEMFGSVLVVLGVLLVLVNADDLSHSVGIGEAEAIVSSFLLAVSVIITTLLLRKHPLATISGLELIFSGILLLLSGIVLGYIEWIDLVSILMLAGLGILPALGIVTYNAGLPKIGASLTSVLFALTGIMTVGVQLFVLFLFPESDMKLPQSVPLALAGGVVAFAGVYLLNLKSGRGE
jgi:drug/metabolite transporter (DMT)-like permease